MRRKLLLILLSVIALSTCTFAEKILLVVDSYYYGSSYNSQMAVSMFANDIGSQGNDVSIVYYDTLTNSSVQGQANYLLGILKDYYTNYGIDGAILVGNVGYAPVACGDPGYIADDFFFMDLTDGAWTHDQAWTFDPVRKVFIYHSDSCDNHAEIWVSRITTKNIMTTELKDAYGAAWTSNAIIDQYLARVHTRLTAPETVPQRYLALGMDGWEECTNTPTLEKNASIIGFQPLVDSGYQGLTFSNFGQVNRGNPNPNASPMADLPAVWQGQLQAGPCGNINGIGHQVSWLTPFDCRPFGSSVTSDTFGYEWAGIYEHSSPDNNFFEGNGIYCSPQIWDPAGYFFSTELGDYLYCAPYTDHRFNDRTYTGMYADGGHSKTRFLMSAGCTTHDFSKADCIGLLYGMAGNGLISFGASTDNYKGNAGISTVVSSVIANTNLSFGAAFKQAINGGEISFGDVVYMLIGAGNLTAVAPKSYTRSQIVPTYSIAKATAQYDGSGNVVGLIAPMTFSSRAMYGVAYDPSKTTYIWCDYNRNILQQTGASYTCTFPVDSNCLSINGTHYSGPIIIAASQSGFLLGFITTSVSELQNKAGVEKRAPFPDPNNLQKIGIGTTLQVEDFDSGNDGISYHDNDPSNQGGAYRPNEGVDIEACSNGGYNVGWTNTGEWMEYSRNITPATYSVALYYASPNSGGQAELYLNNSRVAQFSLPSTGGWQTWRTARAQNVSLNVYGYGVLKIKTTAGSANLDKITFSSNGVTNDPPFIVTKASATPGSISDAVTKQATLSVLGGDDNGEANLTYTWWATAISPGGVSYSANGTNAAKSCVVTVKHAGTYEFFVAIKDQGSLSCTTSVFLSVNPILQSITISPASAGVPINGTQQFSYTEKDQFGDTFFDQCRPTWAVSGGGSIDYSGLFTAGNTAGGPYAVTVTYCDMSHNIHGTASVTVTGGQSPYNGPHNVANGATLQLEDFDNGGEGVAYHDNDAANNGGQYRTNYGVDIENCSAGGYDIGWTNTGEWMEYTCNVTAGSYSITLYAASPNNNTQAQLYQDNVLKATFAIPNTGGYQTWKTVTVTGVALSAGGQSVLKLQESAGGMNLDKLTFAAVVTQYTITASAGANGSISPSGSVQVSSNANQSFTISPSTGYAVDVVTVDGVSQGAITSYTFSNVTANHTISATFKSNGGQTPFNGPHTITSGTTTLQMEDFDNGGEGVAYHDNDATNSGGQYRTNYGVDIENCSAGGYDVGWTAPGEWMEYTCNVAAGTYSVTLYAASPNSNTQVQLYQDNALRATFTIPNTGGWQTWKTVTVTGMPLTAGSASVLKVLISAGGMNLDKITFAK